MLRPPLLLGAPVALVFVAAAVPAPDATLTVRVTNVRNARGRIDVDLCRQTTFLREGCPYSASAAAQSPVTTLVVRGVPPGHYAAQLVHDENLNGKADTGLFGIPKEGVAFSRDALKGWGRPKWADAEFVVAGGEQAIEVRMRYLLGTPGPQGR